MAGRLGLPRDFRFMLCKAHLELPLTLHRLVTWPSLAAGNLRKKVSIPCGQVPRVNLKGLIIAEKKKKRKSVLEQLESPSHLCFSLFVSLSVGLGFPLTPSFIVM